MDQDHVRVVKSGGTLRFAEESLGADCGDQLRLEDLDRHRSGQNHVLSECDMAHAPRRERTLHDDAGGQSRA